MSDRDSKTTKRERIQRSMKGPTMSQPTDRSACAQGCTAPAHRASTLCRECLLEAALENLDLGLEPEPACPTCGARVATGDCLDPNGCGLHRAQQDLDAFLSEEL